MEHSQLFARQLEHHPAAVGILTIDVAPRGVGTVQVSPGIQQQAACGGVGSRPFPR